MSIVVMKFGGSSLADPAGIQAAAARALDARRKGHRVAMVLSAMGDTTDDLIALAQAVCPSRAWPKREMDQLLVTGEQVTISLMAMALAERGCPAISFTAGQVGMVTDDAHTRARLKRIDAARLRRELSAGRVVIIAGFQGVTENGDMTTLGRGGSNVTLVAVAAALKADACENYTDVDGVYTADPRIVPTARKLEQISYDEMLELASLGANVLHNRAVEFAKKHNVPIHVRSSRGDGEGTWIVAETAAMEDIAVRGAALKEKRAGGALKAVPDRPGAAAAVFSHIATAGVVVDDIIQTLAEDKTATLSFTVDLGDLKDAQAACQQLCAPWGGQVVVETDLAKVSVVGVGMRVHTGVAQRMFHALAEAGINIQNITTSEIKISCIIAREQGKQALRLVHDAFALGAKPRKNPPARQTPAKKKR